VRVEHDVRGLRRPTKGALAAVGIEHAIDGRDHARGSRPRGESNSNVVHGPAQIEQTGEAVVSQPEDPKPTVIRDKTPWRNLHDEFRREGDADELDRDLLAGDNRADDITWFQAIAVRERFADQSFIEPVVLHVSAAPDVKIVERVTGARRNRNEQSRCRLVDPREIQDALRDQSPFDRTDAWNRGQPRHDRLWGSREVTPDVRESLILVVALL
jgi:hypothetical protein